MAIGYMLPPASSDLRGSFKKIGCAVSVRAIENLDQSQKSEGTSSYTCYGRHILKPALYRRSKCAPFSRLLLFLDSSGRDYRQHLLSSTVQARGVQSSTWGWVICSGTAGIGQHNNVPRTCSPAIVGFATWTRALSRIIPRPINITASVTLARSRSYRSGPSRTWIKVKNPKAPAATGARDGTFWFCQFGIT